MDAMCSVERTAPVPSKGRERWGPPKRWRRTIGFTKRSRNSVRSEKLNLKMHSRKSLVDVVRAKLLRNTEHQDLVRMYPCHSALQPHVQHANHRLALHKQADEPILEKRKPYNEGQGWIRTDEGVVDPM